MKTDLKTKEGRVLTDDDLIGVFMGAVIAPITDLSGYYQQWKTLMPVVEKIERITVNEVDQYNDISQDLNFSVEIRNNGCRIYRSWTTSVKPDFKWHQTGSKINSVYKAVVEFIKWYNEAQRAQG